MKRDPNYRWNRELQKAFDGVAFQIGNVQGVHCYSSADRGIYTTVSSCVLDMIECQLRRYYVTLCTRICMPGNAVQITTIELYKGWDHQALDYWPRLAFECVIRGWIRYQPYKQPIIPSRILYPPLPPSFSYESVRCEARYADRYVAFFSSVSQKDRQVRKCDHILHSFICTNEHSIYHKGKTEIVSICCSST